MRGSDGFDALGFSGTPGSMRSPDMEMFELSTPHFMEYYEYLPDSAGAGRWRGGLGTTSSFRFDGRDELGVSIGDDAASEGAEPAHGLFGGEPAGLNDLELHLPDGTVRNWGSKEIIHPIPTGSVCVARNGGGGGYGNPHERDAALVLEEVRDGLLSAGKARASYGVAVRDDLSGIDEAETARLRAGSQ
jgi:N-methylhydantoinase B